MQGGLIAGIDVGPILVDITPHTLGIECAGRTARVHVRAHVLADHRAQHAAARQPDRDLLDRRRRPGGRARSGSSRARTRTPATTPWSASSMIEGLAEVPAGNQILVRLDLDLNGILKVTATERATGLAKHVVIDNATERFRQSQRSDAVDRLEAVFGTLEEPLHAAPCFDGRLRDDGDSSDATPTMPWIPAYVEAVESAQALVAKAKSLESDANAEDADELRAMLADLQAAVDRGSEDEIRAACVKSRNSCSTSKTRDPRVPAPRRIFVKIVNIGGQPLSELPMTTRCQSNLGMTCVARPAAPARRGPTHAGGANAICACCERSPRPIRAAPPALPDALEHRLSPAGAAPCAAVPATAAGRRIRPAGGALPPASGRLDRSPGSDQNGCGADDGSTG